VVDEKRKCNKTQLIFLARKAGDDPPSQSERASPLAKVQAWKKSIRYITFAVSILLCFNIAITVGLILRFGATEGVSTLFVGTCQTVAKMDLGLHLAINALSTGIVLASNYVMQCLNAPSRKQVDEAHAKGAWLYIGLPSIRNATRVGWKKGLLWLFLGISAIPLSLL
jgi:hypothetical protein